MALKSLQISLLILLFVLAFLGWKILNQSADTADVSYGGTNGQVTLAAIKYAATARSNIMTQINACGGCAVSYRVSDLIAANAIDPSFSGTTETGGTYCLEFRIYNTNYIQGVLTVIGETSPLNQADALIAAANTGVPGSGYISNGNLIYPGGSVPLSNFIGAARCVPANNAFGALITDNESIGTTNWLCRVTLPGNTSCSTMTIALNMNSNNITNAGLVQAKSFTANANTPVTGDADANNFNATGNFNGAGLVVTGSASAASATISGALSAGTGSFGTSVTATDFFQTSDERLKEGWEPIPHPCETLDALRSGRYTLTPTGSKDDGVGAQSLIAAGLPELVRLNPVTGFYQVNYNGLVPVLMACLGETRGKLASAAGAVR